jgi:hypothetical protein
MKSNPSISIALVIVPAAVLVCASCSTTTPPPPAEGSSAAAYQEGVPGGARVDTFEITATVTAVDHAKRQATLLTSDRKKTQYKAGPDVINFDQVRVGDQVKATVTEELVVYVREKSEPRNNDGQAGLVALAPKGAKPGAVMAATVEVTARVTSVDLRNHKATLEFPDGSTKTVAVRPDVKLSAADVGREVVIQVTQAVAIRVEKPQRQANASTSITHLPSNPNEQSAFKINPAHPLHGRRPRQGRGQHGQQSSRIPCVRAPRPSEQASAKII